MPFYMQIKHWTLLKLSFISPGFCVLIVPKEYLKIFGQYSTELRITRYMYNLLFLHYFIIIAPLWINKNWDFL